QALRDARYTLNDLLEQVRAKDIFDLADVDYAILETNGDLSILPKGPCRIPNYQSLSMPPPDAKPPFLLIQDGKVHQEALRQAGFEIHWLEAQLQRAGIQSVQQVLFAFLSGRTLHLQSKQKYGSVVRFLDILGDAA
ncbi:MAG: DUF421 domain-containing protein, partial [Clostridia bacterium]|nr:DUF421 domain-containing protein [Clostridia bacterium]